MSLECPPPWRQGADRPSTINIHTPISFGGGGGLRCARSPAVAAAAQSAAGRPAAARYSLESRHGYVPIDRLNTWGRRTGDGKHPHFVAQTATVQLLLNHVCPAPARPGVRVGEG